MSGTQNQWVVNWPVLCCSRRHQICLAWLFTGQISLKDNLGPNIITLWQNTSWCVKDPGFTPWACKSWKLKVALPRALSALRRSCAEMHEARCVVTIMCERKIENQQGTANSSVEPVWRSLGIFQVLSCDILAVKYWQRSDNYKNV